MLSLDFSFTINLFLNIRCIIFRDEAARLGICLLKLVQSSVFTLVRLINKVAIFKFFLIRALRDCVFTILQIFLELEVVKFLFDHESWFNVTRKHLSCDVFSFFGFFQAPDTLSDLFVGDSLADLMFRCNSFKLKLVAKDTRFLFERIIRCLSKHIEDLCGRNTAAALFILRCEFFQKRLIWLKLDC